MMKLGLFYWPGGHHVAGWRHPSAEADGGFNLGRCVEIAKVAERGKFHFFFLADLIGIWPHNLDAQSYGSRTAYFEPTSLIAALSTQVQKIGFVATMSTTYNEPYHVARKFASLDSLNGGRTGWNLVTSHVSAEAANFSKEKHLDHADRYERAAEFAHVVRGLWDGWEDDAVLLDKKSGRFMDPTKIHFLNHEGKHFHVRGPLTIPRSPQGQPVLVQAGSSDPGKELAAETADVIFTAANTVEDARSFYADVKARLPRYNRMPAHLSVMPGIFPVIASTKAEAQRKYEELQSLVEPEMGLFLLQHLLGGVDLSKFPLDEPLPDLPETEGPKGRMGLMLGLSKRENLTLRQLYLAIAAGRGHKVVIGTPGDVADVMEEWFTTGASDGFNVLPATFPDGLSDFVDHVVPELQRRGLYRADYQGSTLRENLEIPEPLNTYHPQQAQMAASA